MYLRFGKVAAGQSFPDDLLDAGVATGSLVGFWLMNSGLTSIATAETVMTDFSETSASVVKTVLASSGNWERDLADKPTGFPGSITTKTNRGSTNYMGFDAPCAASKTAIFFYKVATAQGVGEKTIIAGQGGVAAPGSSNNIMVFWDDNNLVHTGDGGGDSVTRAHGDNTGWIISTLKRNGGSDTLASHSTVGGTYNDIGSNAGGGITWSIDWTGFNAFSPSPDRESSTGTVKHAGFMYFSDVLSEGDIEQLLIDGGMLTA